MLVSEQAPEQDVLADHTPGASTFPGTPTSGGWIPILSQPKEGGRPFISDWICPSCKRLTAQSRTCPKCGLQIKETPRIKPTEPFPKGKRIYQYCNWEEAEYGGPRRNTGSFAIGKRDSEHGSGEAAKNKQ
jgi:hypothetical protein